jgi:hypothetical protein
MAKGGGGADDVATVGADDGSTRSPVRCGVSLQAVAVAMRRKVNPNRTGRGVSAPVWSRRRISEIDRRIESGPVLCSNDPRRRTSRLIQPLW